MGTVTEQERSLGRHGHRALSRIDREVFGPLMPGLVRKFGDHRRRRADHPADPAEVLAEGVQLPPHLVTQLGQLLNGPVRLGDPVTGFGRGGGDGRRRRSVRLVDEPGGFRAGPR